MGALPDFNARGKVARDTAANLRRKIKRGKELTSEERDWLDKREAYVASQPKGRPPGSAADGDNDSQSGSESKPEGGGDNPDQAHPLPSDTPPPAISPPPPLEAAPVVKTNAPASEGSKGDWRSVHRDRCKFSDDGRQMLCESLADAWSDALGALVDDMRKAGMEAPLGLDPRIPNIKSMAVLAFDELLPDRARLTPKVATIIVTTAVVGKRAMKHKAITEALKTDPETLAWKKKQAEREARDQELRAAKAAEVKAGETPKPPAEPTHAEPPPAPELERPKNGQGVFGGRDTRPQNDDGGLFV